MARGADPLSEDTIAAIATPQGRGAIALVRLSGPDAEAILRRICPSLSPSPIPPRKPRLLKVRDPESGELLDRAVVTYFPAPASYTGEACVEISTHGGLVPPQLVLAAALAAGARSALPGEFTRRALANGKLDLTQAEAILDLVNGTSPALHRAAIHQLERGLSRRVDELRAGILRVEALVAYGIDFPEEDEPPVPPRRIAEAVESVIERIERFLATAPQGEMLREGALVVLAGYPNSGKSSLFNALVGSERAIVTDLPGTTRDAIEAAVTIRGFPYRLVDTAGLRETEDRVEGLGIEVAHRYLAAADVVLYCAEAGAPIHAGERAFLAARESRTTLLVRTKADLLTGGSTETGGAGDDGTVARGPGGVLYVSTVTGAGLETLADRLVDASFGAVAGDAADEPLITSRRHATALGAARTELRAFLDAVAGDVPPEIGATHLRGAAIALEEIVGVIAPDHVLGALFGEFCVGK